MWFILAPIKLSIFFKIPNTKKNYSDILIIDYKLNKTLLSIIKNKICIKKITSHCFENIKYITQCNVVS